MFQHSYLANARTFVNHNLSRRTMKTTVGLLLLAGLALLILNPHPSKGLRTSLPISRTRYSSTAKSPQDYTVVGYVLDAANNFMVVQKHINSMLKIKDETTNNFLRVMDLDVSKETNYDVHYLEGYNYDVMVEQQQAVVIDKMNTTDLERFDMQIRFQKSFAQFFEDLIKNIKDCKPSIDKINDDKHYDKSQTNGHPNREGRIPLYGGHMRENYLEEEVRTKAMLSLFLKVLEEEKAALKKSHSRFLSLIPQDFPQELYNYSTYNDFMKGDGIVYLGGEKYNQLVLLSIKTLRDTGSKLPVEVILPQTNDYDIKFCLELLPNLNAKCKVMADYVPKSFVDLVKGYQFKNVALLISSFERILYLDADNLCIRNPDIFFVNKPFMDQHLVIWPDLWRRSTSPHFYDIVDIAVNSERKVRNSYFANDPKGRMVEREKFSFHDCEGTLPDPSSETGQLLINKRVHARTLFLSMYYNYYGPDFYYALLSQGAAGEGDKETFIAAAHKLELPYYQVQEFTREFGPINDRTKKHEFYGMGQYDPMTDYIQYTSSEGIPSQSKPVTSYYNEERPLTPDDAKDTKKDNYKYHLFKSSQLFFLHANWPKLYPLDLFIKLKENRVPFLDNRRRRLYNHDLKKELKGYDFELEIFKTLNWLFCDLKLELKSLPEWGSLDRQTICRELTTEVTFLSKDAEY